MLSTTVSLLVSLAVPALGPQEAGGASPLDSRIASVDVYPNTALVTRAGQVPAGDGRFVVRGLPGTADADSVTLRAPGSEIVRLEVQERFEKSVPADEIAAATARLEEVERELGVLRDELELLELLRGHYAKLLGEQAQGDAAAAMTADERLQSVAFVREQLTQLAGERRTVRERMDELAAERDRLAADIGRWQRGETTRVRDVVLELIDTDGDADPFELDYLVSGAHWEPYYDVRADADLSGVDLVFRARVHQRTGEDWDAARVALSTAQPRRRLTAPEPEIRWVDLWDPKMSVAGSASEDARATWDAAPEESADFEVGFAEKNADRNALSERARSGRWAEIQADGVNLRYALPTAQSIPSRPEPSSVLVGRQALEVEMERVCLPEFDTTVWLRGRATNSTPWTLLEGDASVFLGSTFLGRTPLARVQVGEAFDVPLGEDPSITVERIETEREIDTAGVFSSTETLNVTHRIRLVNTSASGAAKRVIVHESVPRATNDRVAVSVDRASPALATGARWKELREERGLVTWALDLGPSAERTIELRVAIGYPESKRISLR